MLWQKGNWQVAYSRPENPMKNETFGSFFKILIGQIQPQEDSGSIGYFPYDFWGILVSRKPMKSSLEPKFPLVFQRDFASHSPIKIRSNLTFPQEIQWEFDGQKANEICPGIHFSLSISKGICICFGIFDIIYFFKLYLFCSAKVQNAKESAKQIKDISSRCIFFSFSNPLCFAVQKCKTQKKEKMDSMANFIGFLSIKIPLSAKSDLRIRNDVKVV